MMWMARVVSLFMLMCTVAPATAGAKGGDVPAALVASWYAGSGYTSAPYNPSTGAWGTPTGKGLIFVFREDGTYTKAFQSYVSNGGCTTGFTAFEEGRVHVTASTLTVVPARGRLHYTDTCSPSLNSDKPLKDLKPETFKHSFVDANHLRLENAQGAASTFQRL